MSGVNSEHTFGRWNVIWGDGHLARNARTFPAQSTRHTPVEWKRQVLQLIDFELSGCTRRGTRGRFRLQSTASCDGKWRSKKIQPRYADDPASRFRFVREAEITGTLERPGICQSMGWERMPAVDPITRCG